MDRANTPAKELALYYPNPMWYRGDWVKNLILFFDGIALLVPSYMKGHPEETGFVRTDAGGSCICCCHRASYRSSAHNRRGCTAVRGDKDAGRRHLFVPLQCAP
jgi:hypothetical protein